MLGLGFGFGVGTKVFVLKDFENVIRILIYVWFLFVGCGVRSCIFLYILL